MSPFIAQTTLILRNDLRLLWREMSAGRLKALANVGLLAVLFVVLNLVAIAAFVALKRPPPLALQTVAWFFFAFMMLGAAMNHAITVLFERADFDLLLSSPVSARAILAARLAAMTVAAALSAALFLVPLLNGLAVGVSARYACGYLVWWLVALAAAAIGVWGTLWLVRWLGPRRARTWSQVIAALIGGGIYVAFQGQNFLPREMRATVAARLTEAFSQPGLAWLARAGRGEGLPLLAVTVGAVACAAVTTRLLARFFIIGIQESGTVKPARTRARRYRFAGGIHYATFRKDARLIVRDPLLLSRTLPTVVYLVPVLFSLHQFGRAGAPGLIAPFCVFATTILSSQLASVAAAGEEGWDLIRLSPTSTLQLRLGKIAAGMAVPMAICVTLALVVVILGRPGLAVFAVATTLVCATAACWLEVATIQPTPRKDLIQNPRGASRPFSISRVLFGALFFLLGTGSVSLAANNHWLLASAAVGTVALAALACFTLVPMRDIEFEAAATSIRYSPAPAPPPA